MSDSKRILIVVNRTKDNAEEVARRLTETARACGWHATITTDYPLQADALQAVDLCVVVGGDGSLLGVVPAIAERPVPVMGVNLGTLGFMANYTPTTAAIELARILAAPPPVSRRRLLEITDARGQVRWALNDLVIRAATSRLARLSVKTAHSFVNAYYADGLIVSTPTGSTAYNLSAGGPILHADAHALVLTPINPHTLTNRAIVLDEHVELSVELQPADTPVQVSADGILMKDGAPLLPIRVRMSPDRYFPLLQPEHLSHFALLRSKLRWTGDTPARLQDDEATHS